MGFMVIDCHVHVAACTSGRGLMSEKLLSSFAFRFMQWRFGLRGATAATEEALRRRLFDTLDDTPQLDAAVILAFDAVYTDDGAFDQPNTHLYVTNDYAIELASAHPKALFGASVNPYRKDALAEVERCVAAGAVLMKWLPMVQGFNPADKRCFPVYEALAHYGVPLLSHTGAENSLPVLDGSLDDPMLLVPALERGVKVIMAHCGTRLWPRETDHFPTFARLAREYEHCYGDTAALNLPVRWRAYDALLADKELGAKVIHGSDWPIYPVPPLEKLDGAASGDHLSDSNWLRRDARIKQALGFGRDYWERAAKVLRLA